MMLRGAAPQYTKAMASPRHHHLVCVMKLCMGARPVGDDVPLMAMATHALSNHPYGPNKQALIYTCKPVVQQPKSSARTARLNRAARTAHKTPCLPSLKKQAHPSSRLAPAGEHPLRRAARLESSCCHAPLSLRAMPGAPPSGSRLRNRSRCRGCSRTHAPPKTANRRWTRHCCRLPLPASSFWPVSMPAAHHHHHFGRAGGTASEPSPPHLAAAVASPAAVGPRLRHEAAQSAVQRLQLQRKLRCHRLHLWCVL